MTESPVNNDFNESARTEENPRIIVAYAPDVAGIRYENLSLWTPRTETKPRTILIEPFTCEFNPGDRATVKGPSGCGKSTLIRSGKNMYTEGSGKIIFNSALENIKGTNIFNTLVIPQRAHLPLRNLKGILTYPAENPDFYSDEAVVSALHKVGLAETLAESDEKLMKKMHDDTINGSHYINELSGGQQQRLIFARAIILNPKLIILDEPNSALGKAAPEMYRVLLENLRPDVIMLSVTHNDSLDEYHNLSAEITADRKFIVRPMEPQAPQPQTQECSRSCAAHCPEFRP